MRAQQNFTDLRWLFLPVAVICLLLLQPWKIVGNIHLASDTGDEEVSVQAGGKSLTGDALKERALGRAEEVGRVLDELANATDPAEVARLEKELDQLLEALTSEGAVKDLSAYPEELGPEITRRIAEMLEQEAAAAEAALEKGDLGAYERHVDHALRLGVAARSFRGAINSGVFKTGAANAQTYVDRADARAAQVLNDYLARGGLGPAQQP